MHVKLKVLRGSSAGKEVAIKGPRFFIGRSEECHLRANNDAISRRHCAITVEDGIVKVRDLGSRNGTFVNGSRIEGEHRVQMGDQLQVGPLEFLVTYLKSAAKAAAAPSRGDSSVVSEDDMAGLIDDWLSESNETAGRAPSAGDTVTASETREFRVDDTNRIDVPTKPKKDGEPEPADPKSSDPKVADPKVAEPKVAEPKVKAKEKSRPPILPTGRNNAAKAAPKDTQEAAAQTLRKFFNRGG